VRKRSSWKFPWTSPKWGLLGNYSRINLGVLMRPPKHIIGQNCVHWCIICGIRALGVNNVCLTKSRKYSSIDNFTPVGSSDPIADRYTLQPIWCLANIIISTKFRFNRLRSFYFTRCRKWSFLLLSDQSPCALRLHVIHNNTQRYLGHGCANVTYLTHSRLECCNIFVIVSLPLSLSRLKFIPSATARAFTRTPKCSLESLHRLKVMNVISDRYTHLPTKFS
jgi:hypothetical protein